MIARLVRFSLLALAVSAVAACSADIATGTQVPPPPPPPPTTVLLKDIVVPNLPSPFYHFDYDGAGHVIAASFGSGFWRYEVQNDGDRIAEMQNNTGGNQDRLVYSYDNAGRVSVVRYIDRDGQTFGHVVLSYDGPQLVGLERDISVAGAFIVDKQMSFAYYDDGNLREIDEHRPAVAGVQQEETQILRFEDYDHRINVDGFTLIHDDFFDHVVLLPQVQLQRGNPRHVTISTRTEDGPFLTTDVVYTYTYDAFNRPVTKIGDVLLLNGPNAGERSQISSAFGYY